MNQFDYSILSFLNSFACQSKLCDHLINFFVGRDLLKGGVVMALIWWAWHESEEKDAENHRIILSSAFASLFSVFITKCIIMLASFRPRPLHNSELGFIVPFGTAPKTLEGWSSFPSDHAALFFALATGILLVSRSKGILAMLYVSFVISVPRIYVGYHYPTDIIAGALIGIASVCIFNLKAVRELVSFPGIFWLKKHPGSFYAFAFLLSYLIATLFEDIDPILHILLPWFKW